MEAAAAGRGCGHGSRTLGGVEPAADVEIIIGGEMLERFLGCLLFTRRTRSMRAAHVLVI